MLNLVFPDGMKVAIIAEKIHYTGKKNCYLYLAQDLYWYAVKDQTILLQKVSESFSVSN